MLCSFGDCFLISCSRSSWSTWSDDNNAEGTDGYETVNELEDMEGDWEVIDEVGDSDEENGEPRMVIVRGSPQDDPSLVGKLLTFFCDIQRSSNRS
jgi:hypothetical protein